MLHDTRIETHALLQAAAAVGRALLPPRPDDSHQSFTWSVPHEALLQDVVDGRFRSGLRIRDQSLLLVDADGRITSVCRPSTVEEGFRFYEEHLGRSFPRSLDHDVALASRDGELDLLTRMYGRAAAVLERRRARDPRATPVRLWPHHFDIAFLSDALGVGFLAGDDAIDEPYWYVYNSPTPEEPAPLPVGEWYRGHWTGAVLRGDPDVATIERFLDAAIAALR